MSVTVFTAFQPKLKGVCPKGVSPTPSDFFAACQEPKHCNLRCFCALAWKKYILQHAETCNFVTRSKKHANTVVLVF